MPRPQQERERRVRGDVSAVPAVARRWPAARWRTEVEDRVNSLVRRAIIPLAGVAELADAQDLKSCDPRGSCGFDPRPRQSFYDDFACFDVWPALARGRCLRSSPTRFCPIRGVLRTSICMTLRIVRVCVDGGSWPVPRTTLRRGRYQPVPGWCHQTGCAGQPDGRTQIAGRVRAAPRGQIEGGDRRRTSLLRTADRRVEDPWDRHHAHGKA